jgi:hypothetical protein
MNSIVEMKMKSIRCEDALKAPDKLFDILREFYEMSANANFHPFPEYNKHLIKCSINSDHDRFNIMASRREHDEKLTVTTMILMNDDDDKKYKEYVDLWKEQVIRVFISRCSYSLFRVCEFIGDFCEMNRKDAVEYAKNIKEKYFDEKPRKYKLCNLKLTISGEKTTTNDILKQIGEKIQESYHENMTMIIQAPLNFNGSYYPFCIMIEPTTNYDEVTLSIGYSEFMVFAESNKDKLVEYPPTTFNNYDFDDRSCIDCQIEEIGFEIYTDLLGKYWNKECTNVELNVVWRT